MVLEIYRITLLSNTRSRSAVTAACFRDLQNYTTLKLLEQAVKDDISFRDLQNYTTLKLFYLLINL